MLEPVNAVGRLESQIGRFGRSLYSFNDVYLHVIDLHNDPSETLRKATKLPGFKEISSNLRPFVYAYDEENWRKPQDALAKKFYRWESATQ